MAMEYIEGVELRTLIGEGQSLGVEQALSIAAQVAEGLGYAHSAASCTATSSRRTSWWWRAAR
jgi:serine/threonine protein kinase